MTHSPEATALLALVAGETSPISTVDWDRVVELAAVHGVTPLLARSAGRMPEAVGKEFREAAASIAIRNLAALQQLLLVCDLLRAEGVRPVATKGPALALRAYGDVARRSFSDLDILVARLEAESAIQVLVRNGYAPEIDVSSGLARFIRVRHEVMFAAPHGLPVEIHWAIAPRHLVLDVVTDEMVARAVSVSHGTHTLDMLTREDEVVYLAAHASKHHWERLAWVVDLDRAIRESPDLDWGEITRVARASRVMRGLRVGCYLSWILLRSDWVSQSLAAIGSDRVAWDAARHLADALFVPGEEAEHTPEYSVVRADFALRDGVGDRIRLVWRTFTTPTEREFGRSQGPLTALYARSRWVAGRAGSATYRWALRGIRSGRRDA